MEIGIIVSIVLIVISVFFIAISLLNPKSGLGVLVGMIFLPMFAMSSIYVIAKVISSGDKDGEEINDEYPFSDLIEMVIEKPMMGVMIVLILGGLIGYDRYKKRIKKNQ